MPIITMASPIARSEFSLDGKVAIVTGSSTGIGRETAKALASLGATVVLTGRSQSRVEEAMQQILIELENSIPAKNLHAFTLDLVDFTSIEKFVERFCALDLPLHLLINNAGMFPDSTFTATADGLELTFASNHLGQYLLTELLISKLKASAPSRIINVASQAFSSANIPVDKLMLTLNDVSLSPENFSAFQAYSLSKLCNIWHAKYLARQLRDSNICVMSLHPGTAPTEISRNAPLFKLILFCCCCCCTKTAEQAASTTLHCAICPFSMDLSGKYFDNEAVCPTSPLAEDEQKQHQLIEISRSILESKGVLKR